MATIQVFLSHASVDKPLVEEVKAFLELGGEIECWLDAHEIDFGDNIVARIDDGLGKFDALLLFLSVASLKSGWVEAEWTAGLWRDVGGNARLIPVLIGDVKPPTILRTKKYSDLRTDRLYAMKALKASLLKAKPAEVNHAHASSSLPNFTGREKELLELKERLSQPGALVPITGMPGLGKTYLAREFVRRHGADFENVYELDCQGKDLAALTGDLDRQLNLRPNGDPQEVARQMREYLAGKRCLLVLDNVDDEQPGELVPGGRATTLATTLVTARSADIAFFADYPAVTPQNFTDEEALALFTRVLGAGAFDAEKAKLLFDKLGHLPIAVSVCAGLIKPDVRYSVESLLSELPFDKLVHGKNNVARLLGDAIQALSEDERKLLVAMAACAAGGVRLGFAAEVAELPDAVALDALQGLNRRSLVIELDRNARRYRLHNLIREAARAAMELRERHANLVYQRLEGWEKDPQKAAEMIEEAAQVRVNDARLTIAVGIRAGNVAQVLGRLVEALGFYVRVQALAVREADKHALQISFGNQALILKDWGRLHEAMALHQKEAAICEELGDRTGLKRSCGNQALILKEWGRLHEAMALHQKEEKICEELGDRAGLQASYGNQALILKAWGRLDEAMALHQKQEKICEELGDRAGVQISCGNQALILDAWGRLDEAMLLHEKGGAINWELGDWSGLQASYGNQALILKAWGRLDEAMALLKKQEAICQELGDRAGLQASYGNQALILKAWGRPDEAMALLKKQEAICQELGDRAGLQASYGNQALILKAWGRLDEARVLHQTEEAICLDLGDRSGLARCYSNLGLLAREQGDLTTSRQKLDEALAIFTELKMTREQSALVAQMPEGA